MLCCAVLCSLAKCAACHCLPAPEWSASLAIVGTCSTWNCKLTATKPLVQLDQTEISESTFVVCAAGVVDCAESSGSVELKRYPKGHPFAQLSGSDNIIAFTTQRYQQQPLIIRSVHFALLTIFVLTTHTALPPVCQVLTVTGKLLLPVCACHVLLSPALLPVTGCVPVTVSIAWCRGPGAGAEVTAGGVFSDLLRLAAYLGAPS